MINAFLASALLALALTVGGYAVDTAKHRLHRVGCAVERVIGKHCAPAASPKTPGAAAPAPTARPSDARSRNAADGEAARVLARKRALEVALALALTPELRADYARVQREWSEAENRVLGIR